MGPGPEPGFFVGPEARLLEKGSRRARSKKPGGFEGLLKDDFFEKKPLLFLDSLLKNVHILNANHSFCPISVF